MTIDNPKLHHIPALRALWKEAFGDTDAFLDLFFSSAFSPDRCRCVFCGDDPVAVLYWFDCQYGNRTIAYLYAIATRKDRQGQGLCARLMAQTHDYLASRKYAGTILVPGSASLFRFYARQGYANATYVRRFSCEAAAAPAPLQAIGPEEYGLLRKQLLPEGSVIQEGENLAFLQTLCRLYRTEDALAAVYEKDGILHCYELLGPSEQAPGILAALGFREGRFTVPGTQTPYTMYHPLHEAAAPAYFGLGFE